MTQVDIGKSKRIFLCLVLALICACGKSVQQESVRPASASFTPNMSIYYAPIDTVWDAVIKTVRYDFLYTLDVVNPAGWFFATEVVRDYQSDPKTKYRISGTLKYSGEGVTVVLYKQQQVFENGDWVEQPSDYSLERQILTRLRSRLEN